MAGHARVDDGLRGDDDAGLLWLLWDRPGFLEGPLCRAGPLGN